MIERQKRKLKIFAVSDIHGHKNLLEMALKDAGFSDSNENHLLVVMGDLFDRGGENTQTLEYLCGIKNKLLLRGNHEDILMETLTSGAVSSLQVNNGTLVTLMEFFKGYSGGRACIPQNKNERSLSKRLINLIDSMSCYFETDNYLFTHGWLPLRRNEIPNGWRYAKYSEWYNARWSRWNRYYKSTQIPKEKILVVGHTSVSYADHFAPERGKDCSDIFFGDRMIAIDATTVVSGRVNVLTLEDEVDCPIKVDIAVSEEDFSAVKCGNKRVEITVFSDVAKEIKPGDLLVYHSPSGKTAECSVVSLHKYSSFAAVEEDFTRNELGLQASDKHLAAKMRRYFSFEQVADNGVLAIVFSLIKKD